MKLPYEVMPARDVRRNDLVFAADSVAAPGAWNRVTGVGLLGRAIVRVDLSDGSHLTHPSDLILAVRRLRVIQGGQS